MKCYGYIKEMKKHQIERQEEEIRKYVKINKLELVKIFSDTEETENKELKEVLKIIEDENILLVYTLSALTKNSREYHNIEADLRNKGCSIIGIKNNVETKTSYGKFFAGITMILIELETDGYTLETIKKETNTETIERKSFKEIIISLEQNQYQIE